MNKLFALAAIAFAASTASAQTSVGVSIGINQPGVYGRIDIGNMPPPAVILPQPVIIQPAPVAMHQRPIYLYVPPGHQKNWARHCARYAACGQPVYFVQERWVQERYDGYRREHGERDDHRGRGEGRGEGRGHGKGHNRD
jgi:hypothetical protein